MDLTKESTQVENQKGFTHILHYSWEHGYIWLSKNTAKGAKIRITTKAVPISAAEKDKFYYSRTGWGTIPEIHINKECSYLDKKISPTVFKYWQDFMYTRYVKLKQRQAAIDSNK